MNITILIFFHFIHFVSSKKYCDGPPYIYVTVHDELKNIIKYSRNGCLLSMNVLKGYDFKFDTELRTMVLGNCNKKNHIKLIIINYFFNTATIKYS
jgi:hypothetical protein